MENCNFWLALRKVIILPSLSSLTIFSIPRNLRLSESVESSSVINSNGIEAMRSTQNRPFRTYLRAILFGVLNYFICLGIMVHCSEIDEYVDNEDDINRSIYDL